MYCVFVMDKLLSFMSVHFAAIVPNLYAYVKFICGPSIKISLSTPAVGCYIFSLNKYCLCFKFYFRNLSS